MEKAQRTALLYLRIVALHVKFLLKLSGYVVLFEQIKEFYQIVDIGV